MANTQFVGTVTSLWSSVLNWTDSTKPGASGDSVMIDASCTIDEDISGLALDGLIVGNDATLTWSATIDNTMVITDAHDLTIDSSCAMVMAPNSSHVHLLQFQPLSNGNCELYVAGTLTMTGSAGYRTGTGTLWKSKLASQAETTEATLELDDDLDLNNGGHGDITKLEVFVEATSGTYTHYDQDFIAAGGYDAGTKIITLGANHTYLHDADDDPNAGDHAANVYVVTRNVQIKSNSEFGWKLTGTGTITATETQFEDIYLSDPTNNTCSWSRCTFTNSGIGNTVAFVNAKLPLFEDCLFYRCYTCFSAQVDKITGQDSHFQAFSRLSQSSVYPVILSGGVISGSTPMYSASNNRYENADVRCSSTLGRSTGLELVNCNLYDYGALGYPGGSISQINCADDLGLGVLVRAFGPVINENQVEGVHKLHYWGSLMQKVAASAIARPDRDYCLEVDPYSNMSSKFPLWVPISKKKVEGGETYTLTVYAAADSTYGVNADPKVLICPGGANATEQELTINIETADAAKDGGGDDTWASETSANIVVSGSAGEFYPIWVYVLVPGGAGLLFLDWEWSDNDDPELENWPLNVIGAAAAGGGGVTRRLAKQLGAS